jgi:hypothetical protein
MAGQGPNLSMQGGDRYKTRNQNHRLRLRVSQSGRQTDGHVRHDRALPWESADGRARRGP